MPVFHIPTPSIVRRKRPTVLALGWGLVASLLGAVVASSEGHDSAHAAADDSIPSVAVLVPDDSLDPRIVAMDLRGANWTRSVRRLDEALFAVTDNGRRLEQSRTQLAELRVELATVRTVHERVVSEAAGLGRRLLEVEAVLRARALDRYVHFGDEPLAGLDDPSVATDAARSATLVARVDEIQFSTREDLRLRRQQTQAEAHQLVVRSIELSAEVASSTADVERRSAASAPLTAEVDAATTAVRSARRTASLQGIDISVVALDAYLNAEALLADASPRCQIQWWMIAGVARIESWHGRFGGRSLRADGRVDRPIIGIALDGGPGVRAMVDTDGGQYDGDEIWDRAVGPLQFIPETWLRRGRDGSGDSYADPQNMYDAAYSAGRYLCALGGDLSTRASLREAYFGYNNSSVYVSDVLEHADRYADYPVPVVEPVENAG